jgi:hypothetical protein
MSKLLTPEFASNKMLYCGEGSAEWLFWRGICLGFETAQNRANSEDWAETVLRVALKKKAE